MIESIFHSLFASNLENLRPTSSVWFLSNLPVNTVFASLIITRADIFKLNTFKKLRLSPESFISIELLW